MRILVLSDSHRHHNNLRRAMMSQPTAQAVIFLGDGEDDIEYLKYEFPNKTFLTVAGNCDSHSSSPLTGSITLEGKRIFYTHGHIYSVKTNLNELLYTARQMQADICLYGHTHIAHTDYSDGLYIMNPGSAVNSCGVIDIAGSSVAMNIIKEDKWVK